ncbi:MAG: hypothetical protein K5982_03940 [Selenomonadaceae bacterium]|nr:hypothetical protein [Selenomonadaceae bacterium]
MKKLKSFSKKLSPLCVGAVFLLVVIVTDNPGGEGIFGSGIYGALDKHIKLSQIIFVCDSP